MEWFYHPPGGSYDHLEDDKTIPNESSLHLKTYWWSLLTTWLRYFPYAIPRFSSSSPPSLSLSVPLCLLLPACPLYLQASWHSTNCPWHPVPLLSVQETSTCLRWPPHRHLPPLGRSEVLSRTLTTAFVRALQPCWIWL